MTGLTRRRFLGSAAGAAGLSLLPSSMQKALAKPEEQLKSLRQVQHVVLLRYENRSFDHYFGTLSGVRGFDDQTVRLPNGRSVIYQPDPLNPDGYELPFHADTTTTSAAAFPGPANAWPVMHQALNGGKNDNWVPTQRTLGPQYGGVAGPLIMGYYNRSDIPFHYAVADAFTICDNCHCSILADSGPNYLYWASATIDPAGLNGGPIMSNNDGTYTMNGRLQQQIGFALPSYTWPTYYERLDAAGISYRFYAGGPDDLGGVNINDVSAYFAVYQNAEPGSSLYDQGVKYYPPTAFMDDVIHDSLPQVSVLSAPFENQEHPPMLPGVGAEYIYSVLDVLASNPDVWAKTVFFWSYDENGGFFDHVPPPTAPPGTPGEWVTAPLPPSAAGIAGPIGLGFRVPMIVISPWSRGGWVASETFDATSILRFMESRFGVRVPNLTAWRRRTVGDLTSALRLHQPDPEPLSKLLPTLPDSAALAAIERQEVATLPALQVPVMQTVPHQEPGHRRHTN